MFPSAPGHRLRHLRLTDAEEEVNDTLSKRL